MLMATEDGYHVVGFEPISGGGAYLRLEQGHDPERYALTIGETASDPLMDTERRLVAHWRPDPLDPSAVMDPMGVTAHEVRALWAV